MTVTSGMVRRQGEPVTYRARPTVERHVKHLLGCRSEGAAHQRILAIRAQLPLIIEGFLEAGANERLTWFLEPSETVLARRSAPTLTPALVKDAVALDGHVDAELVGLATHLEDPEVARATLRDITREIASQEQLRRAICVKHGWQP